MEARLDDVEEGTAAAPQVWETLRDAFKAAHETAQLLSKSGKQTPAQRQRLQARMANAPAELIDALRERLPEVTKPSDRQLWFPPVLVKKAGLTETEACGRGGAESFDALTGGRSGTASQRITAMKREARQEK